MKPDVRDPSLSYKEVSKEKIKNFDYRKLAS
jgi:hypothetical protein